MTMKPKVLALHPKHPERICWGCDKYCSAKELRCGNGSGRTPHPVEIFGEDWLTHGLDAPTGSASAPSGPHRCEAAPEPGTDGPAPR